MIGQAPPPPDCSSISLFLDFDGTLVELADRPDSVIVDPALRDLLVRLQSTLNGRVTIVSGRSISQLDDFPALSGMAMAGGHGVERRYVDGRVEAPLPPSTLGQVERSLRALANQNPGLIVERKSHGVALHYRLAPDLGARIGDVMTTMAAENGLLLQPGKMMMELRTGSGDKGDAIRSFMAFPAMRGTQPVMLGDDLTDEAAFEAAAALGGYGVLVGVPRKTAAKYRLDDVAAARNWLDRVAS